MGSTISKPSRRRSKESGTSFKPYTGPKEFRASVMPVRRPDRQANHRPCSGPEDSHGSAVSEQKAHRQAAQMHQTYQEREQQLNNREGRRYSWEGHSSEKVFITFEAMAKRGIIPKNALKKK